MSVTITVGTNSYITVTDADLYFNDVLFPEPWTTTATATKEKALVAATRKIDSQVLRGVKAVSTQTLQFPRALYSYDALRVSHNIVGANWNNYNWIAETEVHQDVRDAVCEEALAMLKGGATGQQRAELQRMGVKSFSLGALSETYAGASSGGNKLLSVVASQLLARYLGGGRSIS